MHRFTLYRRAVLAVLALSSVALPAAAQHCAGLAQVSEAAQTSFADYQPAPGSSDATRYAPDAANTAPGADGVLSARTYPAPVRVDGVDSCDVVVAAGDTTQRSLQCYPSKSKSRSITDAGAQTAVQMGRILRACLSQSLIDARLATTQGVVYQFVRDWSNTLPVEYAIVLRNRDDLSNWYLRVKLVPAAWDMQARLAREAKKRSEALCSQLNTIAEAAQSRYATARGPVLERGAIVKHRTSLVLKNWETFILHGAQVDVFVARSPVDRKISDSDAKSFVRNEARHVSACLQQRAQPQAMRITLDGMQAYQWSITDTYLSQPTEFIVSAYVDTKSRAVAEVSIAAYRLPPGERREYQR
jgi:hypothetical protein